MADESEKLVPLFVPPLANILANAEQEKGSALTQMEVLRIRDESACIMMNPQAAEAMREKRGFVDVNPDNCWADWHRLRVEMTGNGCLPKIVLCLVGDSSFPERARPILEESEIEHEFLGHDERMVRAFKAVAKGLGSTLTDDLYDQIAGHETVLYVLSDNLTEREAPAGSDQFLHLGRKLLELGGVAIKCDSSGTAHSKVSWTEFSKTAADDSSSPSEIWTALFSAYVQYPIGEEDELYTCGMHLLGKPDLVISTDLFSLVKVEGASPPQLANLLFSAFGLYLLDECREGSFCSGHTFRPDPTWPRMRVVWEECNRYEEDDFFFNPFGYWRFTQLA